MGTIEKDPVSFHGKSGKQYNFKACTLDEELCELEGIYIFTKRVTGEQDGKKKYKRLYVGETNNLATVIKDHENSPCLKQYGVDSICVFLDSNESSRRKRVADIIRGGIVRPPCNVNTT